MAIAPPTSKSSRIGTSSQAPRIKLPASIISDGLPDLRSERPADDSAGSNRYWALALSWQTTRQYIPPDFRAPFLTVRVADGDRREGRIDFFQGFQIRRR